MGLRRGLWLCYWFCLFGVCVFVFTRYCYFVYTKTKFLRLKRKSSTTSMSFRRFWQILELGNATPMASSGALLLLLVLLFPCFANILSNLHSIRWSTREPSLCEPNSIKASISFPTMREWHLWVPILGEEFAFLYIT